MTIQQKIMDTVVISVGLASGFMEKADGLRGLVVWILPFASLGYIVYRWLYLRKLKQQTLNTQIKNEGEA